MQLTENTRFGTTLGAAVTVVAAIVVGTWRVSVYAGDIADAKDAAAQASIAAQKVAEQNQELRTTQAVTQQQIGQLVEVVREQTQQIQTTHDSVVRLEASQSVRRGQ